MVSCALIMRSLHADRRQYRDLCMAAMAQFVRSPGQTDIAASPCGAWAALMGKQSYSTARAPSEGSDAQLDSGIVGRLAYLEA